MTIRTLTRQLVPEPPPVSFAAVDHFRALIWVALSVRAPSPPYLMHHVVSFSIFRPSRYNERIFTSPVVFLQPAEFGLIVVLADGSVCTITDHVITRNVAPRADFASVCVDNGVVYAALVSGTDATVVSFPAPPPANPAAPAPAPTTTIPPLEVIVQRQFPTTISCIAVNEGSVAVGLVSGDIWVGSWSDTPTPAPAPSAPPSAMPSPAPVVKKFIPSDNNSASGSDAVTCSAPAPPRRPFAFTPSPAPAPALPLPPAAPAPAKKFVPISHQITWQSVSAFNGPVTGLSFTSPRPPRPSPCTTTTTFAATSTATVAMPATPVPARRAFVPVAAGCTVLTVSAPTTALTSRFSATATQVDSLPVIVPLPARPAKPVVALPASGQIVTLGEGVTGAAPAGSVVLWSSGGASVSLGPQLVMCISADADDEEGVLHALESAMRTQSQKSREELTDKHRAIGTAPASSTKPAKFKPRSPCSTPPTHPTYGIIDQQPAPSVCYTDNAHLDASGRLALLMPPHSHMQLWLRRINATYYNAPPSLPPPLSVPGIPRVFLQAPVAPGALGAAVALLAAAPHLRRLILSHSPISCPTDPCIPCELCLCVSDSVKSAVTTHAPAAGLAGLSVALAAQRLRDSELDDILNQLANDELGTSKSHDAVARLITYLICVTIDVAPAATGVTNCLVRADVELALAMNQQPAILTAAPARGCVMKSLPEIVMLHPSEDYIRTEMAPYLAHPGIRLVRTSTVCAIMADPGALPRELLMAGLAKEADVYVVTGAVRHFTPDMSGDPVTPFAAVPAISMLLNPHHPPLHWYAVRGLDARRCSPMDVASVAATGHSLSAVIYIRARGAATPPALATALARPLGHIARIGNAQGLASIPVAAVWGRKSLGSPEPDPEVNLTEITELCRRSDEFWRASGGYNATNSRPLHSMWPHHCVCSVGLDAEFMKARFGPNATDFLTGHIAITSGQTVDAPPILNTLIAPGSLPIEDYLSPYSGLHPDSFDDPTKIRQRRLINLRLRALVDAGIIFVGHSIRSDFAVLSVPVPAAQIADTGELSLPPNRMLMSLAGLHTNLLGKDIQTTEHNAEEDARAAVKVWNELCKRKIDGKIKIHS